MSLIRVKTSEEPTANAPAGFLYIYMDLNDNHLKTKDETGTVIDITQIKSGALTLSREIRTETGDYTIVGSDSVIFSEIISDSIITLPSAIDAVVGGISKVYDINRIDNTVNTLKIKTVLSQTINDYSEISLESKESITLISNGINWRVL